MNLDQSKKSQYHSALVANSPITVRVVSEPRESKYRKQGESGHLYVKLDADGYEFAYGAENEDCARPFEGKQGQTLTITATGRGQDARIKLQGEQSAPEAPRNPPKPLVGSTCHPDNQNDSSAVLEACLAQVNNALYLIKREVRSQWENASIDGVVPQFETLDGKAHFQAECSIAWGYLKDHGLIDKLSVKPVWKEAKKSVLPDGEEF